MNRRPKPGEDEDDLLKLQEEFLRSGGQQASSASALRPDKRKSPGQSADARDVVSMEGVEVGSSPRLPIKKSKFEEEQEEKTKHTEAEDGETMEDLERAIDSKDTSVGAVLTSIIERDTRNEICIAPRLGSQGFPSVKSFDVGTKRPAAFSSGKKKKSLFAQQVEVQGSQHFGVDPSRRKPLPSQTVKARQAGSDSFGFGARNIGSCLVDGSGLSASNKESETDQIHHENADKLASMSEEEILEEQKKLLDMIDPKLVEFIKKKKNEASSQANSTASPKTESFSVLKEKRKMEKKQMEEPEPELPIQPSKDWVNMYTMEKDKLEWLKDLPPPPSAQGAETGRPARFDFEGNVLAVDTDIPVNMGLHHHGEEPERAGYTLEEIFQLSRSSNIQQRTLALHTLARIISKAQSGMLSNKVQSPIIPAILEGGVLMLLRWGLDDSVLSVVAAAVDALHALLWNQLEEESLDLTWSWHQGGVLSALVPSETLEREGRPEELDDENKEEETDAEVARRDVVQALVLRMDLLVRFRYIVDNMRPQADTVVKMLEILTRLAEHSMGMAHEINKCPGLMDKIVQEFMPTVWSLSVPSGPVSCAYGLPVSAAVRLVRVLCQSGRNMASSLVSKYNIKLLLLRYLSVEASDLQLPPKEAAKLQTESLDLWMTCVTYGLATETYFDMYSDIVTYVGKLENLWSSPEMSSAAPSHRNFETHLVCVLETMLYAAAQSRSKPGDQSSPVQDMPYEMNWTQVTSLSQPLVACTMKILHDIAANYPSQKHPLHFPTACVNFTASFFELEGQQSGIDAVRSLEEIEHFCKSSFEPLLSSFGFRVLVEHLCPFSNLLAGQTDKDQASQPNLPSHGVHLVPGETLVHGSGDSAPDVPQACTETPASTNMPILGKHSPFGFVVAIFRLALALSKRHKAMIEKVIAPLVKDKDTLVYMKKTCTRANSSPFCTSLFTRAENLLQYLWLKCCVLVPCDEMSVAHRVALNLVSRVGHGDEHLVHDLVTTVVFNQAFLCESSDLDSTSEALESLSLNDVLHLKSATEVDINISKHQLLRDVYSSLAKIRGHYLMAFGGMEKAVIDSRNLLTGKPSEISSQMFKCAGESLMPKDWIYLPLIHVYNKAVQSQSAAGPSVSPQAVAMVTSVLQWSYALEVLRPSEINQVSVTVRLSRVLCALIAGNDLFLEKPVHYYLAGLLRQYSSQRVLNKLDFEEKIPGMTSFYDLYQEVLDHYEAVSFGDAVFGLFVLLPLQQRHSSMLRKAVWGERRKMLRTLRVPLQEMLVPMENFLQPEETDPELLTLQLTSLTSGSVQPAWSPVLYLLAVHHVNRFLFTILAGGTEGHEEKATAQERMWAIVVSQVDKVQDVVFYKHMDISQPKGLQLYAELPHNRQATLKHFTEKFSTNANK